MTAGLVGVCDAVVVGAGDREELSREVLHRLVNDGMSTRQIAAHLGVGRSRIRTALALFQMSTRHPPPPVRPAVLNDRKWLVERYVTRGESAYSLAEALGCSDNTVLAAVVEHGLDVRHFQGTYHSPLWDEAWLRRRYLDDALSMEAIATGIGASATSVNRAIRRFDIPVPMPAVDSIDPAWLRREHHAAQRSLRDIAMELGVSRWAVRESCRRNDIEIVRWVWDLDPVWLRRLLVDEQRYVSEVARVTCLADGTVRRIATSYGIPLASNRSASAKRIKTA